MADGFSLGLLKFAKDINKEATPQNKIHARGFMGKLLIADSPAAIEYDAGNGHRRAVKVKRKQRFTSAQTSTTPSCDVTNTQPYIEDSISVSGFRQLAFHIENDVIAQFDTYASQNVANPTQPNIEMMYEFYDTVLTAANALLEAVNQDLVTTALSTVGVHRATGTNVAVTLNIPLSTTTAPLAQGINKLLYDYKHNGFSGRPQVVGGGLMAQFMMNQPAKVGDAAGLDTRIQGASLDFWYDEDVATISTVANRILLYEPNAVQLIEYMRYRGNMWAGAPGASKFGILVLPMPDGKGGMIGVKFDYQIKFNDCDVEMPYVDGESTVLLTPGYNLILSKTFDLYSIPTNAYRASDVLTGNRGSLAYTITNS